MSFAIPLPLQGELIIKSGIVSKVNNSARKGKKEGERIACVYVTLLAMGCAPIELRADLTKYNSTDENPVGQQLSAVNEGQAVAIFGRMRTQGDYSFFEPERVFTDENYFAYLAVVAGTAAIPAQQRRAA
jgi:hypothetical protein